MKAKNTEVALAKPNVSSNINLSLNQNDMIDVVIEHQLEITSAQLEQIDKDLKLQEEAFQQVKTKYLEKLIIREGVSSEDLKIFNKLTKQYKLIKKDESSINFHTYGEECKSLAIYNVLDIDYVERYKDPFNYAKRHASTKSVSYEPIITVQCKYKASVGTLTINYSNSIYPTIDELAQYKAEVTPILKKRLKLKQEYYTVGMMYLEYKYGEKRVKAKIVKASLKKSQEGRGILAMLEGATNIKLLC